MSPATIGALNLIALAVLKGTTTCSTHAVRRSNRETWEEGHKALKCSSSFYKNTVDLPHSQGGRSATQPSALPRRRRMGIDRRRLVGNRQLPELSLRGGPECKNTTSCCQRTALGDLTRGGGQLTLSRGKTRYAQDSATPTQRRIHLSPSGPAWAAWGIGTPYGRTQYAEDPATPTQQRIHPSPSSPAALAGWGRKTKRETWSHRSTAMSHNMSSMPIKSCREI